VRRFGPAKRTTTALLAAGIGIVSPLAVVLPARAQTSDGGFYATPPPVDESALIPDTKQPDKTYTQKKGCVERSTLGQNVVLNSRPWGQEYLQITKAQEIVRAASKDGSVGGGVKVAVIDTGVTRHPWFQNRLESGGEYVAKPSKGQPDGLEDCDGHGTEVAGIIAAKPEDPQVGFVGVAPDATIVSYRQLSENYAPDDKAQNGGGSSSSAPPTSGGTQQPPGSNTALPPSTSNGGGEPGGGTVPGQNGGGRQLDKAGTAGTLTSLAMILRRIADDGSIGVVNMSVDRCRAADGTIQPLEKAVQAAVHYAAERNVVVVAAAGNSTDSCPQNDQADPLKPKTIVTPPWFADDVLSVGAIDDTGSVASFSVHGPWVGVAAPGTKITSLDPAENSAGLANLTFENGNQATEIQGTSFAAPYVAGLAALVRAKYPNLRAREVVARIKATAQHPAAPGGRDNFVGYGVIDPLAALTQVLPSDAGITAARPSPQWAQLPPADDRNWTPMIVALAGTGGGLVALLITLFVMHTIRRNRPESSSATKPR